MPKAKIEFLQASWLDIDRISDFYLREVGPVSAEKAIDEINRLNDCFTIYGKLQEA